uniref:Gustatory receptor n=1 Tax=Plectus sambesii TaxID=2011161 RepID=A0A914VSQ1_9BILA
MLAAVFMIVSTVLMLIKICRWRTASGRKSDQTATRHHVPVTVIAFIVGLACIAYTGYSTSLPAYIALFENHQALAYTESYEPIFDIIFILVFLVFVPILIAFALAFLPSFVIGEATLNILGSTLLLCFVQKWIMETVLVYTHLCEELEAEGRTCTHENEIHYEVTLKNLTHREYRLYTTLTHTSPLIYTCIMELFPAVWALLVCTIRRRDHISANRQYDPDYEPKTYRITVCYILLILALLIKVALFILQSILLPYYDDHHTTDNAQLINASVQLLSYACNIALFWTVRETWHCIGDNIPVMTKVGKFLKKFSKPWTWIVFDQPDLAILILSGFITFTTALIKFIVHLAVYSGSSLNAVAIAAIFMGDLANLVMILSFYIQFTLIKKFLLFNKSSMKQLAEFQFILHLAPTAIVINLLMFGAIYASKSSILPPYPTNNVSRDNMLALLESAYPGSYLYLTTAAVCWAHVVERMYKAGAYRVTDEDDKSTHAVKHH